MVTDTRFQRWETQGEYMAEEIRRLSNCLEKDEQTHSLLRSELSTLRADLNNVRSELTNALNALSLKIVETDTKVRIQTWYARIMVSTLIPANFALLYKLFFG
jgi:predicted  nucleic acid-binding Zn-ribbon protein